MTRVYCVGLAVADYVFYVDEFPQGANKHRAHDAIAIGGGGAANASVAVARLGGKALLSSRMGYDAVAQTILDGLAKEGVDCASVVQSADARSGFSTIMIDARGDRQIVNFRGATLPEEPATIPGNLDAVLVDTRWPRAAIGALEHARSNGIPGVVDAEAPIDGDILARASHIAFSKQGLRSLIGTGSLADAILEISRGLNAWIAVTDGENGAYYTDNGTVAHCPAFKVPTIDTLAAGDVWHAAFALALGKGETEPRAVTFANAAAALKCARPGGRDGAPSHSEVQAFLETQV